MFLQKECYTTQQSPIQQTIVHVQGPPPSQALPALTNLFCWTGIGQLIQGRVIAALLFASAEAVAIVSCWVVVGFFVWPLVRILAVIDAAKYNPNSPSSGGALLALVTACVAGVTATIGLVFVLVAGSAAVTANLGSGETRAARIPQAEEHTTDKTPDESLIADTMEEIPVDEPEEVAQPIVEKKELEAARKKAEAKAAAETAADDKQGVTYTFETKDVIRGIKRALEVRLSGKVSKERLEAIAMELKSSDGSSYDRTFIGYYIPGMKSGERAWATTHFNPRLEVRILGLSMEDESRLLKAPSDPSRAVIGVWIDEVFGRKVTVFYKNGKLFMEDAFGDDSKSEKEIIETKSPFGRRFDATKKSKSGDHWVIDVDKNLQLKDDEGLFSTSRMVKYNGPSSEEGRRAAGFRTWTSIAGTTIEARFAGKRGKTVTLEKRDGKKIELPLEKLSDEDQAFIAAKQKS